MSTRSQVLSTVGVEVVCSPPHAIEDVGGAIDFDLTYLCSSLPLEERRSITLQVRDRWPNTCIAQIRGMHDFDAITPDYVDAMVSWKPKVLVVESKRLLTHIAAEAASRP